MRGHFPNTSTTYTCGKCEGIIKRMGGTVFVSKIREGVTISPLLASSILRQTNLLTYIELCLKAQQLKAK